MYTDNIYKQFNISDKTINYVEKIESELKKYFSEVEKKAEYNQLKILNAFIKNKLSDFHFETSTGYGYTDKGRDVIEKIYADLFKSEDALVRQQIVSGTHAIYIVLAALTKYGDEILSINGLPYDTLNPIIGMKNELGSLKENGINFKFVNLKNDEFDLDSIKNEISNKTKIIMIQRSRGYAKRKSFSINDLEKVIDYIRKIKNDVIIFVDNCYGELVDIREPIEVDADIIAGSLIKNIGGGIARTGGYIVGKKELIERCAYRLTAPGIGKEVGISFGQNLNVLQGLYFAPNVVSNVLKGIKLFAKVYNSLGFKTYPNSNDELNDIVLAIEFGDSKKLKNFCKCIQSMSCVDSYFEPEFMDMPGYEDKIIMAAGNFISGSSIELSCDAPLREPYIAYLQGGLSFYQIKLALMKSIEEFL